MKLEVFNPPMESIRKERYEKYLNLLRPHISSGKVLDVGSGYGTGAKVFSGNGYQVEVVEAEMDKIHFVKEKQGLNVVATSIEELTVSPSTYDMIIFSHCLEHVDDPVNAIQKLKRLLKQKTGLLYLEVPLLENSVSWSDALYLCHKTNFSEPILKSFVKRSGFNILDQKYFRHTEEEPWDLGLILQPYADAPSEHELSDSFENTLSSVRKLYLKNLPKTVDTNQINSTIRYNVPHIEQFFCTLKLDSKTPYGPDKNSGFIEFRDQLSSEF